MRSCLDTKFLPCLHALASRGRGEVEKSRHNKKERLMNISSRGRPLQFDPRYANLLSKSSLARHVNPTLCPPPGKMPVWKPGLWGLRPRHWHRYVGLVPASRSACDSGVKSARYGDSVVGSAPASASAPPPRLLASTLASPAASSARRLRFSPARCAGLRWGRECRRVRR